MIDLHTHTFMSDGALVASELIRRASCEGYRYIAITDHADASNLEAVIEAAKAGNLEPLTVEQFEAIAGRGVKAIFQEETVLLGNERLMKENNIELKEFSSLLDSSDNLAATPVLLARAGVFAGILLIEDQIKPDSAATIEALHKLKIKTVMLSGDRQSSAEAVAASVGIDEVIAEVLPDEKEQVRFGTLLALRKSHMCNLMYQQHRPIWAETTAGRHGSPSVFKLPDFLQLQSKEGVMVHTVVQ